MAVAPWDAQFLDEWEQPIVGAEDEPIAGGKSDQPRPIGEGRPQAIVEARARPDELAESAASDHDLSLRLRAMILAARHHGVELDPSEFQPAAGADPPTAAALSNWAQNGGLWARAVRIGWRQLIRLHRTHPVLRLHRLTP